MASRIAKIVGICGLAAAAAVFYRFASAKPNEDFRNYEVVFIKPSGWMEIPKNPNTLLLVRHPQTQDLIRCSETQVVADHNPEPDVDTEAIVKRTVSNAQSNQPEWKTSRLPAYDNGRVQFELFCKRGANKTIVIAMAVRGNTTLLASISNTGARAAVLERDYRPFLDFLATFDLRPTDKWDRLHEKYDRLPN
jgi:hypothetical protein